MTRQGPPPTGPKPRRRRLQYTLRTLLLLLVLASLGASWLATKMYQARRQREAIDELKRAGVYVGYAWSKNGRQQPYGPAFLRLMLGDDVFNTPVQAGAATGEGTSWTESAVESLRYLPHLKRLTLADVPLSDDALEHVHELTELEELSVARTGVTGKGLVWIAEPRRLKSLWLANTKANDDTLQIVEQFVNLEELSLQATQITDEGLRHLRPLRQLRLLHLGQTRVTDAGLVHLKGLDQLRVLDLNQTRITDAGVRHLAGMSQLEYLSLSGTGIGREALGQLWKALPNARVTQ